MGCGYGFSVRPTTERSGSIGSVECSPLNPTVCGHSSWEYTHGIYLEHPFVRPEYRKNGLG